jgi:hypothetical protein
MLFPPKKMQESIRKSVRPPDSGWLTCGWRFLDHYPPSTGAGFPGASGASNIIALLAVLLVRSLGQQSRWREKHGLL